MDRRVFISYSSKDKKIADSVCSFLEANQIQCWITPRDILPGTGWAESIVDAIESSSVFVLVFSSNSNTSHQVIREVERAADRDIPIIPFRIEDIVPSKAMQYYISRYHWLDATKPPLEKGLEELCRTVKQLAPISKETVEKPEKVPEEKPVTQAEIKEELKKPDAVTVVTDALSPAIDNVESKKQSLPAITKEPPAKPVKEAKKKTSGNRRLGLFIGGACLVVTITFMWVVPLFLPIETKVNPVEIFQPAVAPLPPLEAGKGRVVFDMFAGLPESMEVRKISSEFLFGLGTRGLNDASSVTFIRDLRRQGINNFLLDAQWAAIEASAGNYYGEVSPGQGNISWLQDNGANLTGNYFLSFNNDSGQIPKFAFGRTYSETKEMLEKYVRATVSRFTNVKYWTLYDPVQQNCFDWTLDQSYETYVSASRWIRETNAQAKIVPVLYYNSYTLKSGVDYNPKKVLDDLLAKGIKIDAIGIDLWYDDASKLFRDANGYPTMEFIKLKVDIFRGYNLPIMLFSVDVPWSVSGKSQTDQQANWLESLLQYCKSDSIICGVNWGTMRDHPNPPTPSTAFKGIVNTNLSYRPVMARLLKIISEWNPFSKYYLKDNKYFDIDPGNYDVLFYTGQLRPVEVFSVIVKAGQSVTLLPTGLKK